MSLPETTLRTVHIPSAPSPDIPLACLDRLEGAGGMNGDLILFVHGLACVKESFSHAFDTAALETCSMIVPDLPGHGETGAIDGFSYSMEDTAAVLAALLEEIPYQRLHILAHSMGGAAALLLVENHGIKPASFINVEGNLTPHDCGQLSRRAADIDEDLFVNEKFIRLVDRAALSDEDDTRLWASWAARTDPAAFHRASVSLVKWSDSNDLLPIYQRLTCPKMYVYGSRSAVPAVLSALEQSGEGTRTCEIPMAGHFSMAEEPVMFYDILCEVIGQK